MACVANRIDYLPSRISAAAYVSSARLNSISLSGLPALPLGCRDRCHHVSTDSSWLWGENCEHDVVAVVYHLPKLCKPDLPWREPVKV